MQGDVRPGGGVGGGGEVVGVGLALHLEHGDRDLGGQLRLGGEPFGGGPAIDHPLGTGVAGRQLDHVVEGVVDEHRAAEALGGGGGHHGIGAGQQLDQRAHVVAADHGGQQAGGFQGAHQGAAGLAAGDGREPAGLHVGGLIHPRRDAFAEQLQQEGFFAGRRRGQQLGEGLGLGRTQGQGRHPQGLAFGGGGAVGGQQFGGGDGGGGVRHGGWGCGSGRCGFVASIFVPGRPVFGGEGCQTGGQAPGAEGTTTASHPSW